ncbi:hypothetical protein AWQ21_02750 [Picosynechococcus sp. PCC 7003]|nr:hypothetical protein AWQ21_02750 [Picosynechococcus sp. PCC 7003]
MVTRGFCNNGIWSPNPYGKNGTGRIRTGDLALQIGVGFPDSLDYLFTLEIGFDNQINFRRWWPLCWVGDDLSLQTLAFKILKKACPKTNPLVSAPSSGEAPKGLAQGYPMTKKFF